MVQPIVAIDFDGVIHNHLIPASGRRMGEPFLGAQEALEELEERGYAIVVHTVMAATPGGKKVVEDWLDYYGLPYDQVTALKPNAVAYIDDRALRHTDWGSTMLLLRGLLGLEPD